MPIFALHNAYLYCKWLGTAAYHRPIGILPSALWTLDSLAIAVDIDGIRNQIQTNRLRYFDGIVITNKVNNC